MMGVSARQSTHQVAKKLTTAGPLTRSSSVKLGAGSPTVALCGGVGRAPTKRKVETIVSQVAFAEASALRDPTSATTRIRLPSSAT